MRMNESTTSRIYDLWSRAYDWVMAPLMWKQQGRAVAQLHLRPGDRVLDIGVGTGIALSYYPRNVQGGGAWT